jgi:hypothetical protein
MLPCLRAAHVVELQRLDGCVGHVIEKNRPVVTAVPNNIAGAFSVCSEEKNPNGPRALKFCEMHGGIHAA